MKPNQVSASVLTTAFLSLLALSASLTWISAAEAAHLDPRLAEEFARVGPEGTVRVGIWLDYDHDLLMDHAAQLRQATTELDRSAARQGLKEYFTNHTSEFADELVNQTAAKIYYVSQYSPIVFAEVTAEMFHSVLASSPEVDGLFAPRQYRPTMDVTVPTIRAHRLHANGQWGMMPYDHNPPNHYRIGIIEVPEGDPWVLGKSVIDFGHPAIPPAAGPPGAWAPEYCFEPPVLPGDLSDHATAVAGIVVSTDPVLTGVAPGVAPAAPPPAGGNELYSGNSPTPADADIIRASDAALSQGCIILNLSFGGDTDLELDIAVHYYDLISLGFGVTVVAAAGNRGLLDGEVTSPGLAYNVITVGSFTPRENEIWCNDRISDFSSFVDPPLGDRNKPEVVAPGENRTDTRPPNHDDHTHEMDGLLVGGGFGPIGHGTSYAAPHVTGLAALMMEREGELTVSPEAVKAIIMASAMHNIEEDERLSDRDGAGGVVATYADEILRDHTWASFYAWEADFPVNVLVDLNAGERTKAAICWYSHVDYIGAPDADLLYADLDLEVWSPGGVKIAESISADNNYEVIDLTAPEDGQYTFRIVDWSFEYPREFVGFACYQVEPDYGDAPDPLFAPGRYPSLFVSNGARHKNVDHECEWLADQGGSVDAEPEALVPDNDNFDDGVVIGPLVPGAPVPVFVYVNTTGSPSDDHEDRRYDITDPLKMLYVHGWFDWDGNGVWASPGELEVIWHGVPAQPAAPAQPSGTDFASASFVFPEVPAGPDGEDLVLLFEVDVPPVVPDSFCCRFRLDWGEDIGNVGNPITDPSLAWELGEAQFGEVEDYCYGLNGPANVDDRVIVVDPVTEFALSRAWPNPCRGSTLIDYAVPAPGAEVRLAVYNAQGQRVRELVSEKKQMGCYRAHWDGLDDRGRAVSSGTYFVRMEVSGFTASSRVMLVR